jgi:hypothetical protein
LIDFKNQSFEVYVSVTRNEKFLVSPKTIH